MIQVDTALHRGKFDSLMERLQRPTALTYAAQLLEWDERTQVARGGKEGRAIIKGHQAAVAHEAWIDTRIGELLRAVAADGDSLEWHERRLVERLLDDYRRSLALQPEFVEEQTRVNSLANSAWEQAKATNDPEPYLPHLERVLDLKRQEAVYLGADRNDGNSMYTALLQGYEPGMTTERIQEIAETVCSWLTPFLKRIAASPVKPDDSILRAGHFAADAQERLSRSLTRIIGYDYRCGHLTTTVHPFCTHVGPSDVRITTRYDSLSDSLFGSLHESGHAMYDQGMAPLFHWAMPIGFRYSLGIHESQSRMWENMVGRSRPFWEFAYPILCTEFPQFASVPLDQFMLAVNTVKPSPIRTKADEVTYNPHIALRVLLEIRMIRGELSVSDHIAEFAKRMREYVGYDPKTYAEGAGQDTHWSSGLFGYFGTYKLGNLTAAQLFATFRKAHPEYEQHFRMGRFGILLGWLRAHVHPYAALMTVDELLTKVTGEPLNPQYWFDYITDKYGALYELE